MKLHASLAPSGADRQEVERASHASAEDVRRQAALQAIGNVRGAVLLVDCDAQCVTCAGSPDSGSDWRPWEGRSGKSIIAVARRLIGARSHALPAAFPMRVGGNVILAAAPFSRSSLDGVTPFVAVHVAPASGAPRACDRLSPREQQVARLLAEGYSNVNVSAICGVSTNTARTLIRRIYRKLGVFNRADFVREMMRY